MSRSDIKVPSPEPAATVLPAKLYFRIGEVANLVGVEPHVLRYWEREFRSIRPTKSAKGQRVYSRKDVENLLRVRELLYAEGFTIAGAKKRLVREAPENRDASAPPPREEQDPGDGSDEPDRVRAADEPEIPQVPGRGSGGPSPRARGVLLALRVEVEDFLRELGA